MFNTGSRIQYIIYNIIHILKPVFIQIMCIWNILLRDSVLRMSLFQLLSF